MAAGRERVLFGLYRSEIDAMGKELGGVSARQVIQIALARLYLELLESEDDALIHGQNTIPLEEIARRVTVFDLFEHWKECGSPEHGWAPNYERVREIGAKNLAADKARPRLGKGDE